MDDLTAPVGMALDELRKLCDAITRLSSALTRAGIDLDIVVDGKDIALSRDGTPATLDIITRRHQDMH
jgi:hypothetical protein